MNIVVIGMGYPSAALRAGVGIPCAALLADVSGYHVTGIQRRFVRIPSGQAARSGWKIDCLNRGECPFSGDEPGLAELIQRVAVEKRTFRVSDDYAACAGRVGSHLAEALLARDEKVTDHQANNWDLARKGGDELAVSF